MLFEAILSTSTNQCTKERETSGGHTSQMWFHGMIIVKFVVPLDKWPGLKFHGEFLSLTMRPKPNHKHNEKIHWKHAKGLILSHFPFTAEIIGIKGPIGHNPEFWVGPQNRLLSTLMQSYDHDWIPECRQLVSVFVRAMVLLNKEGNLTEMDGLNDCLC